MAQAPCGAVPERLFGEVVLRVPQTKDLSTWTFTPCVVPRLASKKLGLQQRSQGTQTTLGMWGTQLLWGNGIFGVHKQPRRDIYIYIMRIFLVERYIYTPSISSLYLSLYLPLSLSLTGSLTGSLSLSISGTSRFCFSFCSFSLYLFSLSLYICISLLLSLSLSLSVSVSLSLSLAFLSKFSLSLSLSRVYLSCA